jgi:DNA-binding NtrC family response regulator
MPAHDPGEVKSIRILLVDRDVHGAMTLADQLATALIADPDVVAVRSGRDAVELLRSATFDLLLVDLETIADFAETEPAVARLVRLAPTSLVVALSDGQSVTTTLAALSGGAHDHLARPIDSATLVARLAELARRHGRDIAAALASPADAGGPLAGLVDASGQLQDVLALVARDWPGQSEHLEGLARRIVEMFGSEAADAMRPAVLPMWRQEQRIIEEAIASFSGNITLAAQALELSPSTIYRKRQAWAELEGNKGAA